MEGYNAGGGECGGLYEGSSAHAASTVETSFHNHMNLLCGALTTKNKRDPQMLAGLGVQADLILATSAHGFNSSYTVISMTVGCCI